MRMSNMLKTGTLIVFTALAAGPFAMPMTLNAQALKAVDQKAAVLSYVDAKSDIVLFGNLSDFLNNAAVKKMMQENEADVKGLNGELKKYGLTLNDLKCSFVLAMDSALLDNKTMMPEINMVAKFDAANAAKILNALKQSVKDEVKDGEELPFAMTCKDIKVDEKNGFLVEVKDDNTITSFVVIASQPDELQVSLVPKALDAAKIKLLNPKAQGATNTIDTKSFISVLTKKTAFKNLGALNQGVATAGDTLDSIAINIGEANATTMRFALAAVCASPELAKQSKEGVDGLVTMFSMQGGEDAQNPLSVLKKLKVKQSGKLLSLTLDIPNDELPQLAQSILGAVMAQAMGGFPAPDEDIEIETIEVEED